MIGLLHSIETMGLVDGPGTRTIFFSRDVLCAALTATIPTRKKRPEAKR